MEKRWQRIIGAIALPAILALGCASSEALRPEPDAEPPVADDRTWVAIYPIQCLGNPWEQAWLAAHDWDHRSYPRDSSARAEIVREYYEGEGIAISDIRFEYWSGAGCYACSCYAGYTLYLLVGDEDVEAMVSRGYRVWDPGSPG